MNKMTKRDENRIKAIIIGSMHYTFQEIADYSNKHRTTLYSTLGFKNFKYYITDLIKKIDNDDPQWNEKLKMIDAAKRNLMNLKSIVEQLIEMKNGRCRNYLKKIQLYK